MDNVLRQEAIKKINELVDSRHIKNVHDYIEKYVQEHVLQRKQSGSNLRKWIYWAILIIIFGLCLWFVSLLDCDEDGNWSIMVSISKRTDDFCEHRNDNPLWGIVNSLNVPIWGFRLSGEDFLESICPNDSPDSEVTPIAVHRCKSRLCLAIGGFIHRRVRPASDKMKKGAKNVTRFVSNRLVKPIFETVVIKPVQNIATHFKNDFINKATRFFVSLGKKTAEILHVRFVVDFIAKFSQSHKTKLLSGLGALIFRLFILRK